MDYPYQCNPVHTCLDLNLSLAEKVNTNLKNGSTTLLLSYLWLGSIFHIVRDLDKLIIGDKVLTFEAIFRTCKNQK